MKRLLFLTLALMLVISLNPPRTVHSAVSTTWSAVIEYYNPVDVPDGQISVIYYKADGGWVQSNPIDINAHQAGTILVGQVGTATNFTGSAVISATVPLLSVYKQVSNTRDAFSPLLYTSFNINEAGAGVFYIPTVRRVGAYDLQIAIQNVELTVQADMSVAFYPYNSGTATATCNFANVPVLSAKIIKLSEVGVAGTPGEDCTGSIPAGFDGSVVITSQKDGAAGTARVIAVVQETEAGGRRAYAYEGINAGSTNVFMPTAMCKYGTTQQTTYFAVQNVDSSAATVIVDYYDGSGTLLGTQTVNNVPAKAKVSISSCDTSGASAPSGTFLGNVSGKNLSARIHSTRTLAVVGKVVSTDGLMTAFTGRPAPTGTPDYVVVLPYVEWSSSNLGYRTYMAVMNTGAATAYDIKADFYSATGVLVRSYNLAVGPAPTSSYKLIQYAKRSFDPSLAKALTSGTAGSFKGAVVITSDQPIVVLARVQRGVSGIKGITTLGEDYTGVLVSP